MRPIACLATLAGVLFAVPVLAAPFDDLAERLQAYEQAAPPRPDRFAERTAYEEADAPPDFRDHQHTASYQAEAVTPEPVAEPQQFEPFSEGSVWDEGCDSCGGCLDGGCGLASCECRRFWGRAEYLQWWVRGSSTPALVTTSPDDTPLNAAGVLPGATVLFGDGRINGQGRSGGRYTLGFWLDYCNTLGVENTFFFLGDQDDSYGNSSNGSPILARPFFNVDTDLQDAVLIAYPEIVVGSINVTSYSRVYGNEFNVRRALYADCCRRTDLLAGYRFFQLAEQLQVNTNTTSIDEESTIPVGTTFGIFDTFGARSQFHGGQLGLNTRFFRGCWTIDLLAKVALGGMKQTVSIDGSTVVTVPGAAPVNNQGGILALPSNIGQYSRNRFAVVPEFGVNLHRSIGRCWNVNVGYTFMLVSNVVRPGDQIDTQLDPNQFPPPSRQGPFTSPSFAFNDSDLWLQGINVGLEYNY